MSSPTKSPTKGPGPNPGGPDTTTTIRETIIANWKRRCSNPIHRRAEPLSRTYCEQCGLVREYAMQERHKETFLVHYLAPISEVFSFDEMTAFLNQHIAARLLVAAAEGEEAKKAAKQYSTVEDFTYVAALVKERKWVFDEFILHKDRFGMIRDDVRERARREMVASSPVKKGQDDEVKGNSFRHISTYR
ncbi:hypothetical protein B0T19DRAFT_244911 [Cercophora scortea]|uniref:Uncharacterized protein n=1 Tax=Cercophora scortea TaxID=314031 RepID=A0AAE0M6C7_9PEZI|nr:hypothetical protein B0T19DRAFT_244911 [Cercophora scortea]